MQFADREEATTGTLQPGNCWIAELLQSEAVPAAQAGPIFRRCGPISTLYTDGIHKYSGELGPWLKARGHQLRVITAPPYFPGWRVSAPYRNRYSLKQREAGEMQQAGEATQGCLKVWSSRVACTRHSSQRQHSLDVVGQLPKPLAN